MSYLRVIAGSAKKTNLKSPKGLDTRPTADRVKEAVFNILAPKVPGCFFLDLFAGTGSVAIEALSRGAGHAVLVENNRSAVNVIKENLTRTKLSDNAELLSTDVFNAIKTLALLNKGFDIIYLDPPYREGFYQRVLLEIADNNLLNSGGIVVAESSRQIQPPEQVANLSITRRQRYGDTVINFYQFMQQ